MKVKVYEATLLTKSEYHHNEKFIHVQGSWWLKEDRKPSPGDNCYYCFRNSVSCAHPSSIEGIVPAIRIDKFEHDLPSGSKISYAGLTFTALNIVDGGRYALCDTIIHEMAFREEDAQDANIYAFSDIRKWLNEWYNANGDEAETIDDENL